MTKETEYVKNVLTILNRDNKIDLLKKSNLYDREINLLVQRFVHGLSLKELAEQIVKDMAVTDGSERENGQKWNIDQTSAVGSEIGIDWGKIPKLDFYVVMNMVYSDYYSVAEKIEYSDDSKFYAYMAKAWLCDEDVPSGKLFKYIFHVLN